MLITGSDGLLGTELKKYIDGVWTTRADLDVTNLTQVFEMMMKHRPSQVLHLAAYTNVSRAENDGRKDAWRVNVEGTLNIVRAARFLGARVIYISTDYVFDGKRGGYEPDDAPDPLNYYGLTKLMGECAVRSAPSSLIIRTSHKPSVYPHPIAYEDMWTSADYTDVIAPLIVNAFQYTGICHVGTERKSVYELIRRRNPQVAAGCRHLAPIPLPGDVSFGPRTIVEWEQV